MYYGRPMIYLLLIIIFISFVFLLFRIKRTQKKIENYDVYEEGIHGVIQIYKNVISSARKSHTLEELQVLLKQEESEYWKIYIEKMSESKDKRILLINLSHALHDVNKFNKELFQVISIGSNKLILPFIGVASFYSCYMKGFLAEYNIMIRSKYGMFQEGSLKKIVEIQKKRNESNDKESFDRGVSDARDLYFVLYDFKKCTEFLTYPTDIRNLHQSTLSSKSYRNSEMLIEILYLRDDRPEFYSKRETTQKISNS